MYRIFYIIYRFTHDKTEKPIEYSLGYLTDGKFNIIFYKTFKEVSWEIDRLNKQCSDYTHLIIEKVIKPIR